MPNYHSVQTRSRILIGASYLLCFNAAAVGQQAVLALISGNIVVAGGVTGKAVLPIALLLPSGSTSVPVALQWTFTYNPSQITGISIVAGSALTSAGKSLSCAGGAGTYTCIGTGQNSASLQSGIVGTATFTVAPGVSAASIAMNGALGANLTADAVSIFPIGGTITNPAVPKTQSSVNCRPGSGDPYCAGAPSAVTEVKSLGCDSGARPGGRVRCTVEMEGSAPAGGTKVSVASGSASVTLPSVVQVREGHRSAGFEALVAKTAQAEKVGITVRSTANPVTAEVSVEGQAPYLASPGDIWARAGSAVQFTVAGVDPANFPVTLSARHLPDHLSFDAVSGVISWVPSASQQGTHAVEVAITNTAGISGVGVVRIHVSDGKPVVSRLVNAASRSNNAVCSAGSVASVEGEELLQEAVPVQVKVNEAVVPVVLVSPERVDFVCPPGEVGSPLSVTLENGAGSSTAVVTNLVPTAPGIYTVDNTGGGQGAVKHSEDSALAAIPNALFPLAAPAQPGDMLSLYATGIQVSNTELPLIHMGDATTRAVSALPVAGHPGMVELQFRVPPGLPHNDHLALYLEMAGSDGKSAASNTVAIAVDPLGS